MRLSYPLLIPSKELCSKCDLGTGEMDEGLTGLAALAQDSNSIPCTHKAA